MYVLDVIDLILFMSLVDNDLVVVYFVYFMVFGKLDLFIYFDIWDGYLVVREKFYQFCQLVDVMDLIVLIGDSYVFWVNQLYVGDGDVMGVELGIVGIILLGDFELLGFELVIELDLCVVLYN